MVLLSNVKRRMELAGVLLKLQIFLVQLGVCISIIIEGEHTLP